jgi:DNA-binding IclR family transcriptional regulator
MNHSVKNRQRSPLNTTAQTRIKAACSELEAALADFENNEEADRLARAEAERLAALRQHLDEIRRQLEDLSN